MAGLIEKHRIWWYTLSINMRTGLYMFYVCMIILAIFALLLLEVWGLEYHPRITLSIFGIMFAVAVFGMFFGATKEHLQSKEKSYLRSKKDTKATTI